MTPPTGTYLVRQTDIDSVANTVRAPHKNHHDTFKVLRTSSTDHESETEYETTNRGKEHQGIHSDGTQNNASSNKVEEQVHC